ncbi:MAG: hypothetical protein RE469_00755 [Cuniculiplasma divulgatum]|nr:MAG: hypothetical protein RE469_00755 [Cuniculiplasma divulgatum]
MPARFAILYMTCLPPSTVTGSPYWFTRRAVVFLLDLLMSCDLNGRYDL